MAQAKLIEIKENENGILLTFKDLEGKVFSGIYNRDILDINKLNKLLGHHVSFDNETIYKAWNENGKPIYSKLPYDGDDRSSR